jgi:hypothetical protein
MGAVERRFGAEAVRAMDRGGAIDAVKLAPAERNAVGQIGRVVQLVRGAERAAAAQAPIVRLNLAAGRSLKP